MGPQPLQERRSSAFKLLDSREERFCLPCTLFGYINFSTTLFNLIGSFGLPWTVFLSLIHDIQSWNDWIQLLTSTASFILILIRLPQALAQSFRCFLTCDLVKLSLDWRSGWVVLGTGVCLRVPALRRTIVTLRFDLKCSGCFIYCACLSSNRYFHISCPFVVWTFNSSK